MGALNITTKSIVSMLGVAFLTLQAPGAAWATTLTFDTSNNPFSTSSTKTKTQGFFDNRERANRSNSNDSYTVGKTGAIEQRDYFTFDFSKEQNNTPDLFTLLAGPIESVQLVLSPGTVTSSNPGVTSVAVKFGSVTTDARTLNTPIPLSSATTFTPPIATIFNDLGAGNGNYGMCNIPVTGSTPGTGFVACTLSNKAIADIQNLAASSSTDKFFSIGGLLSPSSPDVATETAFGNTSGAIARLVVTTPTSTPTPGKVPEPSTVGGLLLAGVAILRYRKTTIAK